MVSPTYRTAHFSFLLTHGTLTCLLAISIHEQKEQRSPYPEAMLRIPKPVAPERTIILVDCISFPPVFGQLEANVGLSYLPKRELTICGYGEMITVGLVMPEARNQGTPRPKHGQVLAFWSIVPFFHFLTTSVSSPSPSTLPLPLFEFSCCLFA